MFVHLHVHSHFSFGDSPTSPGRLVKRAAALGMPALALTDHKVLHGVPGFVAVCRREGIRPLVGLELSVVSGCERSPFPGSFHLVLLGREEAGYRNLCRLSRLAQGQPVSLAALDENAKGLICLSGSRRGPLLRLLVAAGREKAARAAQLLREVFPGSFYAELPATGAACADLLRSLVELAQSERIPLVATADVHYAEPREALVRSLLLAGRGGEGGDDEGDGRGNVLHLCAEEEMERRLAFLPSRLRQTVLARTGEIAEECRWELRPLGPTDSPASRQRLRRLVEEGRRRRYPEREPETVEARLTRELEVILARGLADYFLLAREVTAWCRQEGIPVGPGRGSAAGSLVCYCLGVTDVDPLAEDLLFERFLNPERPDFPDIDLDVCQRRRPEVLEMLARKVGAVGVVTFTTLGTRSALRLAGKALGIPEDQVRGLAAAFPRERGLGALAHAWRRIPELRAIPPDREPFRTLFAAAVLLEGVPVGRSRHPSGVVALPPGKEDLLPVYMAPDGQPVSQYDTPSLEGLGLPKLDVLGLRHLTVAEDTARMVRQAEAGFTLQAIDPGDPAAWDLIVAGDTVGCFQLESEGMRELLRRIRPRSLGELAMAVASYKPGPLRARAGTAGRPAFHLPSCLEPILAPTGGLLVYQEQVMEAGHRLAGMSLGEADLLRRAFQKPRGANDQEDIRRWEARFLRGAGEQGVPEEEARAAFAWLRKAAGYAFNRAHATCYARLAYQAAYLKAHHAASYLAALLSNPGGYYPPDFYLYEARRLGIAVLPPHPNLSGAFWRAEGRAIRAGLLTLPGVGYRGTLACLRERAAGGPFRSPEDLVRRLKGKVPSPSLSSLLAAWRDTEGSQAEELPISARVEGLAGAQVEEPGGDLAAYEGREVLLRGRVAQAGRIPAAGGYRLLLLVDTGREMVQVHVPPSVYRRDALRIDPSRLRVRGKLERRGGYWRLLASAVEGNS